jgi:hypothetical protein
MAYKGTKLFMFQGVGKLVLVSPFPQTPVGIPSIVGMSLFLRGRDQRKTRHGK